MSNDNKYHPRFMRMKRDTSLPVAVDIRNNINRYWNVPVALIASDDSIHNSGKLENGVPEVAKAGTYRHDDIVWMRWEGKNLALTRSRDRDMYSKQECIDWIDAQIAKGANIPSARPCFDGLQSVKHHLSQPEQETPKAVHRDDVMNAITSIREHLKNPASGVGNWGFYETSVIDHQLKLLLDYISNNPLMPEEPSEEILEAMSRASSVMPGTERGSYPYSNRAYIGLRNKLLESPKPKMKKVWCVAGTDGSGSHSIIRCKSQDLANRNRDDMFKYKWKNISPIWEQEVPA